LKRTNDEEIITRLRYVEGGKKVVMRLQAFGERRRTNPASEREGETGGKPPKKHVCRTGERKNRGAKSPKGEGCPAALAMADGKKKKGG